MCLFDARQKRHPSIILADITLTLCLQIRIFPTGSRRRSKCLLQRAMFSFHVLGKLVKSDACFVFLYLPSTERDAVVISRCLSFLVENSSFKLMSDGQIEFLCTHFCSGFLTEILQIWTLFFISLQTSVLLSFAVALSIENQLLKIEFPHYLLGINWILRNIPDEYNEHMCCGTDTQHDVHGFCLHRHVHCIYVSHRSPPVSILFTQIYYYISLIWAPKMVTYQPHLCLYLMCSIPDSIAALADETTTHSNQIQTRYHRILFHCFVE